MKKKVTAKKLVKKSSVKLSVKNLHMKKGMHDQQKLRSFWKLFDKVKNHNVVEGMPEAIFQHVFVQCLNLIPQDVTAKTSTVFNDYLKEDYLKEHDLQKYEVEIQHLRYLLKLQEKGVSVPESRLMEEFVKRSGSVNHAYAAAKKLTMRELSLKNDPVKMIESSVDFTPQESKEALDKACVRDRYETIAYKTIADAINSNSEKKFNRTEDNTMEDNGTVVTTLSEDKKLSIQNLVNIAAVKQEAGDTAISNAMLKGALKFIAGYADNVESKVVAEEERLPKFWQELKSSREVFEKFSKFYAKKYADHIESLRDLQAKEKKYLQLDESSVSEAHHLELTSAKYLKTQRDLEVLKKVLDSAYKSFHQLNIIQADLSDLESEMAKYSDTSSDKYFGIFDHLLPPNTPYVIRNGVKTPVDTASGSGFPRNNYNRPNIVCGHPEISVKVDEACVPTKVDKSPTSIADEIQNLVLRRQIDPNKDFPLLIDLGLDEKAVKIWKEKFFISDEICAAIDDPMGMSKH